MDTDANWTYIRRSEDVQHAFWTSYVRSTYALCPRGPPYILTEWKYYHIRNCHIRKLFSYTKYRAKRVILQHIILISVDACPQTLTQIFMKYNYTYLLNTFLTTLPVLRLHSLLWRKYDFFSDFLWHFGTLRYDFYIPLVISLLNFSLIPYENLETRMLQSR